MYTDIPPVRCDLWKTKIYFKKPKNEDNNFIVLSSNNPYLYIQNYKTAKTYGDNKILLPKSLSDEINKSIIEQPREYLFTNKKNNAYNCSNSYTVWANRVLNKVSGKKLNLTMLRHIFISNPELDIKNMTGLEKDIIAKQMGHSIAQQDKYFWKNNIH